MSDNVEGKVVVITGGASGIAAGDGYTVQVSMAVPTDLSPDFGSNGIARANPASVSADDADTKSSSTNVTVTVPRGDYAVDTHTDSGDRKIDGITRNDHSPKPIQARTDSGDVSLGSL